MGSRSAFIVLARAGNHARWDPKEGREASRGESHYQATGRDHGPCKPVNEMVLDSRTGEEEAGNGAVLAEPCHRLRMDARSLHTNPQGWSNRYRWSRTMRRTSRQTFGTSWSVSNPGTIKRHRYAEPTSPSLMVRNGGLAFRRAAHNAPHTVCVWDDG